MSNDVADQEKNIKSVADLYMKIIKQSTYETCLACCLLILCNKNKKEEIKIWKSGWKWNFLSGQLNYVAKKFHKKIEAYVENKIYCDFLKKEVSSDIKLIQQKIDLSFLKKILLDGPVIVYLDVYYLQKIVHGAHFVIVLKIENDLVEIADSVDGQIKKIPIDVFKKSISSLRNHMKFSPVVIRIL